jgi:hypothetical protein
MPGRNFIIKKKKNKFTVLVTGTYHHKMDEGIRMMCKFLDYDLIFNKKVDKPDLIMCPSYRKIVGTNKVIYGPQFNVFPCNNARSLDHGVYFQHSPWVVDAWSSLKNVPLKTFPFPINTEKFKEIKPLINREDIIFYFKHRDPKDYDFLINKFKEKNINPIIFDYDKRYSEENYLKTLQNTKYKIVLAGHESQGFGIQEAMSCNVPLLVWNVKSMNQEYGTNNYDDIPATTVSYWDDKCGELFYKGEEFDEAFDRFVNKLNIYKPREFILDNLDVEKCSKIFKDIIDTL